jgi:hypothetical protein
MQTYAILFITLAAGAVLYGFIAPAQRRLSLIAAGGFALIAALLFGLDCAISTCVYSGELYVPKR